MIGNTEVEYKYWTDMTVQEFQERIRHAMKVNHRPMPKHLYAVSVDDYYLDADKSFIRHRKSNTGAELTVKKKLSENVVRTEVNINVDANSDLDVSQFTTLLGYERSFQVYKEAWIWDVDDLHEAGNKVDISYYTLADGRNVIELEAHIEHQSVEAAIAAIDWWEHELDLSTEKKEPRSLYEIFTEELNIN